MIRRPCMTDDEWALWSAPNLRAPAPSPCVDCPAWFAVEQRGLGCCNGEPGGTLRASVTEVRRAQWRESKRRQYARTGTISLSARTDEQAGWEPRDATPAVSPAA